MKKLVTDPLTDKQYTSVKQIIEAHNVSEYLVYSERRKGKTLKQALEYAIAHSKKPRKVIDPNTGAQYKSYKEMLTVYGLDCLKAADTRYRKGISYEDQVRGLKPKKSTITDNLANACSQVMKLKDKVMPDIQEDITKLVESLDSNVHPSHYTYSKYECINVLKDILGEEGFKEFCRGNVFKYLWRYNHKNGKEDLLKAKYYLEKLIEVLN